MVNFLGPETPFLFVCLKSFTKLGILVDQLVINVLVLNWLLNSIKFVVLFRYIYYGSEWVVLAKDLWVLLGLKEHPRCF